MMTPIPKVPDLGDTGEPELQFGPGRKVSVLRVSGAG